MEGFLTKTTLEFNVSTEAKAAELIEEVKSNALMYELKKYATVKKEIKEKGVVVDEYYLVTLNLVFNDAKNPDTEIEVSFNKKDFSFKE